MRSLSRAHPVANYMALANPLGSRRSGMRLLS